MMRTALVAAVLLAVAGCGGSTTSSGDEAGLLVVEQTQDGGPYYIEGAKSYVSAAPEGGGDTQEVELTPKDLKAAGSLRLDAGRYTLASWQRPCDGNCSYLDPPTDRCSGTVEIASGGETRVTITLTPGKGCEIAVPR